MATGYRQPGLDQDVLEHPFVARWAAGELNGAELAVFASEYERVVSAIATAAARAAALEPRMTAASMEEMRHVSCWRAFSREVGWGGRAAWAYGEETLPETEACARGVEGDSSRTLSGHLETLRAIDGAQAGICEVMLSGLLRHYGFAQGAATEYFRIHAELPAVAPTPRSGQIHHSLWMVLDGVAAART